MSDAEADEGFLNISNNQADLIDLGDFVQDDYGIDGNNLDEGGQNLQDLEGQDLEGHGALLIDNNDKERENSQKFACPFCDKQFQQRGSYGRHLDYKRGDDLHPAEEIDKLRQNVIRRSADPTLRKNQDTKRKRQLSSKKYNLKEDIREKNKLKRKIRDRQIKAKLMTYDNFFKRFNEVLLEVDTSFARYCSTVLPIAKWPLEQAPDEPELHQIIDKVTSQPDIYDENMITTIKNAFDIWSPLSPELKLKTWKQEKTHALSTVLGDLNLYELQNHERVLVTQASNLLVDICAADNLPLHTKTFKALKDFKDFKDLKDFKDFKDPNDFREFPDFHEFNDLNDFNDENDNYDSNIELSKHD